jgi:hypothetical protein
MYHRYYLINLQVLITYPPSFIATISPDHNTNLASASKIPYFTVYFWSIPLLRPIDILPYLSDY